MSVAAWLWYGQHPGVSTQQLGVGCWVAHIQHLSAPCCAREPEGRTGQTRRMAFPGCCCNRALQVETSDVRWEERETFSRLGRCCACPQLCDRGRGTQGWGWHRFEGRSQLCTHPACRSEWPSGGFSQPFQEGLWLLVELVHVWSLSLMQTPSAEPPRLHPWP